MACWEEALCCLMAAGRSDPSSFFFDTLWWNELEVKCAPGLFHNIAILLIPSSLLLPPMGTGSACDGAGLLNEFVHAFDSASTDPTSLAGHSIEKHAGHYVLIKYTQQLVTHVNRSEPLPKVESVLAFLVHPCFRLPSPVCCSGVPRYTSFPRMVTSLKGFLVFQKTTMNCLADVELQDVLLAPLYSDSSPLLIYPTMEDLSENLCRWQQLELYWKSNE